MSLVRRLILLVALAVSAVASGAPSASAAITVSNPGTFTMSDSGNVAMHWTLYGFPGTITCSTANLTGSVSSSGAFSITAATFSGCTDGLGGLMTLSPTSMPWVGQVKGSTGAYRLDGLPWRLNLTPSFGGTCSYNGGTLTTLTTASPLTGLTYSAAGPLTSTTAGCGPMDWNGTYNLSRSLTISGSL